MTGAVDGMGGIDCEKFHNIINCCYLYASNEYRTKTGRTMINDKERKFLLPPLFNAAVRAGAAIMEVYKDSSTEPPSRWPTGWPTRPSASTSAPRGYRF